MSHCESCEANDEYVPATQFSHEFWLCAACAYDLDYEAIIESGDIPANDHRPEALTSHRAILEEALTSYDPAMQRLVIDIQDDAFIFRRKEKARVIQITQNSTKDSL